MLTDLRYALRTLARTPALTASAILILATGIGANTAVFSALNTLLFRPLPYGDAERLAMLGDLDLRSGLRAGTSLGAWEEWNSRVQSFDELAAVEPGLTLPIGPGREYVTAARVSTNFFTVLRVPPILGREFTLDDATPSSPDTVIVSAELWQRLFGAREDLGRRTLVLTERPHAIVGVLPEGFRLSFAKHDVWLPVRAGGSSSADR